MAEPHYTDEHVQPFHGDCLDVLRELPDASVDSVVTDPPYGLEFMGKDWDAPWKASSVGRGVRVEAERASEMTERGQGHSTSAGPYLAARVDSVRVAGLPFQQWCTAWATECLRILKPGGHLLSFGGSRTWHRLAAAVEDAGFEIRDSIAWLYGSGFPKSLDVSKAIDKARDDRDAIRVVCRFLRAAIDSHPGHTVTTIADAFGFHPRMVEHWAARDTDSQPSLPTLEQWDLLRALLGFGDDVDAEVLRLNLRKGEPGEAWADRPVTGRVVEWENRTSYALTSRDGLRRDEPASDAARRWQGWGTALKPSFEPITVGRKPLAGTVAANVLAHGTGALNIDACRVEHANEHDLATSLAKNPGRSDKVTSGTYGADRPQQSVNTDGRWPTNVVLDEHQAAELDRQSGASTSRIGKPRGAAAGDGWGMTATGSEYADTGGASRFFPVFRYEAKAPSSERPRVGDVAHPTVKPLDLMRWLVRLVTPPGGTVLEPFAGSGTTAEACVVEGFRCIAIEREADYLPLIVSRLTKPIEMVLDLEAS